jgi:hypothetical protein
MTKKSGWMYVYIVIWLSILTTGLVWGIHRLYINNGIVTTQCIIINQSYIPYQCSGTISNNFDSENSVLCGPTENYQLIYHLRTINNDITSIACNRYMPTCNCCIDKNICEKIQPKSDFDFNFELRSKCMPIIDDLWKYNKTKPEDKIDCWIYDGNLYMTEIYDSLIIALWIFVVSISLMIFFFGFLFLRICYTNYLKYELHQSQIKKEIELV